jgi:hypothetical protein
MLIMTMLLLAHAQFYVRWASPFSMPIMHAPLLCPCPEGISLLKKILGPGLLSFFTNYFLRKCPAHGSGYL